MLIFILSIIGAIVGVGINIRTAWEFWDYVTVTIFGSIIGGGIGFFAGLLLTIVCTIFSPDGYYKFEKQQTLVSLKDSNAISGQFFLGSGQINNQSTYAYYTDVDGIANTYTRTVITDNTNNITITEVGKLDKPYVKYYVPTRKGIWQYITFPMTIKNKVEFYVPTGTVKKSLDLGN